MLTLPIHRYMGRMKTDETKVASARSASISMRTTIPEHIVSQLNIEVGDTLKWDMDKVDDKTWIATIRKK